MKLVCLLLSGMVVGCASQQVADESAPSSAVVAAAQVADKSAPVSAVVAEAQVADESAPASATIAAAQVADEASGTDATGQPANQEALASAAETESSKKAAADFEALLKSAKFKAVNQNGQTVYCKRELVTGSRLQTRTTCYTAAELERIRTNAQDVLSDLSRRAPRARMDGGS